jgi:hypothetical protein
VTTAVDGPIDGVTNDGLCSLREAVLAARSDVPVMGCPAGAAGVQDTLRLPAGTFPLAQPGANEEGGFTGDLDVQNAIRVAGAGAAATVIAVSNGDRAFDVLVGADLALEDLTIRGAQLPGETGANAGAIRNQATLSLTRVLMDANAAAKGDTTSDDESGGDGGAIWSGNRAEAKVSVVDSTFTANRAGPGASGGNAGGDGGAIRIAAGTLTVSGSTFAGNAAGDGTGSSGLLGGRGGNGGAIAVGPGSATVTNSTFASNGGGEGGLGDLRNPNGGAGGAIWVSGGQGLVAFSTFAGNVNGLASNGANGIVGAFVGGSILADPDLRCGGVVATAPNLLSSPDASCPAPARVGDPRLGPLAANGGPTLTRAPGPGSAAIDALPAAGCPATDQRGLPRPALGACDAGAVEVQPTEPAGVAAIGGQRRGTSGLAARRVSGLALGPATFRAARSGGSVGALTKALQQRAPIGTTVRYRLDGAARVTFTVTKAVPGRRKGKRCVKPGAAKPGAKRCSRTQKLKGSFAHAGVAGQNSFRFTGRLRGKALPPGRYTLVARLPRPATGAAALARKAFRIVR